jgi:hypothetical protein
VPTLAVVAGRSVMHGTTGTGTGLLLRFVDEVDSHVNR